ncbi:MAG TPA: UDP-N-acetylglucosamine--LPS N-acetylglucosamine transferase, partial [Desulfobacteria bacterium]|nr:UDP-N-acetylglucosamine--LPS N-acetylglucosamine transferase [Desulfobacteria bacterium]
MKNLRVLVLSASFGAGHISAAKAIIEAIQSKQPDAEINHLDYFAEFFNKTLYNLVRAFYVGLIKHVPWIWGKLYYKAGRLAPDSLIQRWLNQVGRTGLLKYIQATEPDVIVCTYPTLAGILGELRLYGLLDVPVVTVVTDFVAHRQWVHHGI